MIIKIHIYLFLMMAYMYACGNLDIFMMYYVFVIMHEIAHVLIALLVKIDVPEITLLPIGINAKYEGEISSQKEFLISLAGPIASFLFFKIINNSLYASFNLLICITNLMPMLPFDGGKIISTFISKANKLKVNFYITRMVVFLLMCFSIFQIFVYKNYYFIIFTGYIYSITKEEIEKEKVYKAIDYLQTKQETLN